MLRLIAAAAFLAVSATSALAQTAGEVVEKHLAALGGREALSRLRTRVSTGTVTLTTAVGPLSGTLAVFVKAPNKSRTLVKIDATSLGAGVITSDQRFDGNTGYVIDTFNGNRDITGSQLEAMRNNVFPSPFLESSALSYVTLVGKESFNGRPAFVLEASPPNGPKPRAWLDAETYMILKTAVTVELPAAGQVEQITEFGDYRTVDGVQVPFSIKSINPLQTVTAVLTDVKHNVEIDDGSFVKP